MYLIVDCETSGLPRNWRAPVSEVANWPRAVQVAWALYDARQERVLAETRIVRPDGFTIPADAVRVHGITTERAMAEGRAVADVLGALAEAASSARVVVAHNAAFDASVLGAEYLRLGRQPPFTAETMICTMRQSAEFCRIPGPYGFKWPTLDELHAKLFGIGVAGAHDAGADVAACAACFFELVKRSVIRVGA
jgi:DNA polymerase III epsilon subunit-like protein